MKLQGMAIGRLVGHLGFLILIVLSVVLAQERVLFVDSAAQLFEMIQRGTFVIYDHRYTMAVTQLLPLIGIKIGLPLSMLVVLYSVAAPLLGYAAFLLLAYRVKDIPLALLLLLPMLCICHTFFHAISETFSLMIYATLLLALLRHPSRSWLHVFGMVLAVLACVFIHPIGIFFVVFLLGYHLVDNSMRPSVSFWVGLGMLVVAIIVRSTMISGHDASFIPTMADARYSVAHITSLNVVRGLVVRPFLWIVTLALFVVTLVVHVSHHQWMKLSYGILYNLAFIAMSVIVYRDESGNIAIERSWLPLVFFAGVPVVCEILPVVARRVQRVVLVLFAVLLMVSYGKSVDSSKHYRARLDGLQEIVERGRREGCRKLVAPQQEYQWSVQSWATAFETLILSSLDGPDGTVTLYLEEEPIDEGNPDYGDTDAYLAVPWNRLWNYSTLDPRYFRLPAQPCCLL